MKTGRGAARPMMPALRRPYGATPFGPRGSRINPQNDGRIQLTLGQQNGTAQALLLQGFGFRPETYPL